MVDVFEQVEEELRSDRYKRLARTWLPVAGGVLLVALIAALAFWGWDSLETSRADKASVAYDRGLESLEAGNPVGADAAFIEAAKEGNGAYKSMALAQRAGIALAANRVAEAIEHLDAAAKASSDPLLSDTAAYKAALLAMDTETLEQIEARLAPLVKDGRPMSTFALEARAMAWLQHGKTAEAREALVLLKNGLDTPDIVTQRADLAIAAIDAGGGRAATPGAAASAGASNIAAIVRAQAAIPVAPPAPVALPAPAAAPARP
ncbi:MAG: tetratricopeptide repeat protein [Caulobacteraceae bacterium]|nr:tetratricopeptide repeat protein [Caulobacteraceae bacterium]